MPPLFPTGRAEWSSPAKAKNPLQRGRISIFYRRDKSWSSYMMRGGNVPVRKLFFERRRFVPEAEIKKQKCGKPTAWYGTTSLFKSLQELRIARELLFSLFAFSTPRCVANSRSCLMTIGACGMGCHCKKQARRHFSFLFLLHNTKIGDMEHDVHVQ